MQCPRCQGSGNCSECQGSGKVECAACEGKGQKTTSRGTTYSCKPCQGTGSVDCPTECSSCAGSGEITEKLQQETRDKYQLKFVNFTPSGKITIPLVVAMIVIQAVLEVEPQYYQYLIWFRESWDAGYYWTILTPSFIHTGVGHLVLNMMFFYYWGQIVEGLTGTGRYIALILATGVAANVASFLGNTYWGDGSVGMGSSGPGFGLMGYVLAVHYRWGIGQGREVYKLAYTFLAILGVGFVMQLSGTSLFGWQLDNWGHLGGAVTGFLLGYLLPRPRGH